ncbi:MAG: hypothetical protein WCO50_01570 [Synechococcus sp. ELA619]
MVAVAICRRIERTTDSAASMSIIRRWLMAPAPWSWRLSSTTAAGFGAAALTIGNTQKMRQGIRHLPGESSMLERDKEKGDKLPPRVVTNPLGR